MVEGNDMSVRWEIIGVPECPILARWEVFTCRFGKLMVHRFFPGADREDCHDHPASFLTFVLRGGYDDIRKDGTVDRLRAPTVRFRRAEHEHTTLVGTAGALTVVLMGPKRRAWGFWRSGFWFPFRTYEERWGARFRCGYEEDS